MEIRISNKALAWIGAFFWALGMVGVPFMFAVFAFTYGIIFRRLWNGDVDK